MKNTEIIEGVVAELNGKFWGVQYKDGHGTSNDFGDLTKANIGNPDFCKSPTDMTWNPEFQNRYNPDYELLKKAKLVKVRKTIIIETYE